MRASIDEIIDQGDHSLLLVTTRSEYNYKRTCDLLKAAGHKPNDDLEVETVEEAGQDFESGDEYLVTDDVHTFTVTVPLVTGDSGFDEAYEAIATIIEAA